MTIEATSKVNNYRKHYVNYFQSWHKGTTNKLLQKELQKRTHNNRHPEAVIVTYHHTVGENGLGSNRTQPIITKSFKKCSISNDLDGMDDDVLWAKQYDKSDTDSDEGDDRCDDTQTDTTDVQ